MATAAFIAAGAFVGSMALLGAYERTRGVAGLGGELGSNRWAGK